MRGITKLKCFFLILSLTTLPLFGEKINIQKSIIGTKDGLFYFENQQLNPLWQETSVQKIIETENYYYLLTDKGIYKTLDFITFNESNSGLPFSTIKNYKNKEITFTKQIHGLKDLEVHPENPNILVTGTRDEVFITYNGGNSWESLGFSARSMGLKAVSVANLPTDDNLSTELVVFMTHPIYGLSYIKPHTSKPKWIDITAGFDFIPTMKTPDEIGDIITHVYTDETGKSQTEIFLSQTFIPRIFKLNWSTKRGEKIWEGPLDNYFIDGMQLIENNSGRFIYFTGLNGFNKLDLETKEVIKNPVRTIQWDSIFQSIENSINCAFLTSNFTGFNKNISLTELWALSPNTIDSKYADKIIGKKSLYIPIYQASLPDKLEQHLSTAKKNKLNSVVLDMKDDNGLLRFDARNPEVLKKCYISAHAIKLEPFIEKLKAENLYLIARIVVFKDKHLSTYNTKEYAVWDKVNNTQWRGIRNKKPIFDENNVQIDEEIKYYDEYWVDPYCQEVWEYNVQVAQELIERGFDEIQFDYIRFPTDGENLGHTQYRWKNPGMDMESALISFLNYARENIDAPIGIDIYGANGWYRSGVRTGQDVELLAPFVDVISPMFYPSHFDQPFLAYEPAEERPYRIYYFGTYRNTIMGRNQILVRPWLQAFYYNVSYDRKYYNNDYVAREVFGTRDSLPLDNGYMYWNNIGRYDDLRPDPEENEIYPWGKNPQ